MTTELSPIPGEVLLNSCLRCDLKFPNAAALASHLAKFCTSQPFKPSTSQPINSSINQPLNVDASPEVVAQMVKAKLGETLDWAKGIPCTSAEETMAIAELHSRVGGLEALQLAQTLRKARTNIRLEKIEAEEEFAREFEAFERAKQRQLESRLEKERIKANLHKLNFEKMELLRKEKERELLLYEAEKEKLRQREQALRGKLSKIAENLGLLDKEYKEEEQALAVKAAELHFKRTVLVGSEAIRSLAQPDFLTGLEESAENKGYQKAKLEDFEKKKASIEDRLAELQVLKKAQLVSDVRFKPTHLVELEKDIEVDSLDRLARVQKRQLLLQQELEREALLKTLSKLNG